MHSIFGCPYMQIRTVRRKCFTIQSIQNFVYTNEHFKQSHHLIHFKNLPRLESSTCSWTLSQTIPIVTQRHWPFSYLSGFLLCSSTNAASKVKAPAPLSTHQYQHIAARPQQNFYFHRDKCRRDVITIGMQKKKMATSLRLSILKMWTETFPWCNPRPVVIAAAAPMSTIAIDPNTARLGIVHQLSPALATAYNS